MQLSQIVYDFFQLYFWVIIVRIFLTWIPSIDWYAPFFRALAIVSDAFLAPFRKIIPPMGGLDFSPIIALFALQFIQIAVVKILLMLGL